MNTTSPSYKHTNSLVHESSPYLLQHANNPVNWYPWGEEALQKAQKENKLIIVSIGYAACHWCHVMEHESFEDEGIAKYMNNHFVSIKVDREERPDIDLIYMNAVQLISGTGGWPLNCIALPDGRPIYGGTYFPKANWLEMLKYMAEFVKNNPSEAEQQAVSLIHGIQTSEKIYANNQKAEFTREDLDAIFSNWKGSIDFTYGGYDRAPKFPLPVGYQFLLQYHHLTNDNDALKAVITTLDKMSDGGIYDQIGGGFSRYSVDAYWKVPHFEKMLYDNAQLVSLYSVAYQKTKKERYKTIVFETLDFIERELTSGEGAFYSSLDADSEGVEGKFYIWTKAEINSILSDKADLIAEYYNITNNGNWENGENILFITQPYKQIADKFNISENELIAQIKKVKNILLKEREKRIRPGLDDKILTSWNALMLKAYVDAYKAFGNKKHLKAALRSAEFINAKIKDADNKLYRNYKKGKVSINGFLDDYAFTIAAFISLYQVTFNEKWLFDAHSLTEYTLNHFFDNSTGMFFYTSDIDPDLITRKMEVSDNVIPSSNSEMAKNIFVLGHYFNKSNYIDMAKQMLNNVKEKTSEGIVYYANWDILMTWFISEPYEIAIVGENFEAKLEELNTYYTPNVFQCGGKEEGSIPLLKNRFVPGQTNIYVCRNKTCKLPAVEVEKALKQIKAAQVK